MANETLRAYLLDQIESLEPLEFVALFPSGSPQHVVEVGRGEDNGLEVRVPGRMQLAPPLPPEVLDGLRARGLASDDEGDRREAWSCGVANTEAGLNLAQVLLHEVFESKPGQAIDVIHGNHREEHQAKRKLELVRQRLEPLLEEIIGETPRRDPDGDYLLSIGDVQVTVAPRALPGEPLMVRIFAVTNVGVSITPEIGLMLARLNFGLMFGRFALDALHNAIWFDETLLGEEFTDEALRFAVRVVAHTADEWDDRLKQLFGGVTYQETLSRGLEGGPPPVKPGEGPGLYL